MSQHVEVVQQAHDAFNRGDFDGFIELFDADCEYLRALETEVEGRGGIYSAPRRHAELVAREALSDLGLDRESKSPSVWLGAASVGNHHGAAD